MRMISTAVLTIVLAVAAAGASAQSGLHNEKDINDRLLVASVVDKLNRGCGSIKVQFWKAQSFVNELKADARALGYSRSEVNAYIGNKANRAAMRKRRDAFFKSNGASSTDPASLCVFGHAEIQKQSQIGELIRAK